MQYMQQGHFKNWFWLLSPLGFLLVCIFFIGGCFFGPPTPSNTYYILRPTSWEGSTFRSLEKNIEGFLDDLLLEIALVENIHIIIGQASGRQIVSLLGEDQVDGILSSLTPTPQTNKEYLFSKSCFVWGPVLVVEKDSPYSSMEDMMEKEVAFERGSSSSFEQVLRQSIFFHPYDHINQAIEDLISGKLEGVIIDSIHAYQLSQGLYANKLRIATAPLHTTALRLIVKKGKREELIDIFNEGLAKLRESGIYAKILTYWNLIDASTPLASHPTEKQIPEDSESNRLD
jgi:polar amino acid transport system substrate-binding protein